MQELKDRITIKNIIFLLLVIFVIHFICTVKNLALLLFASFVIACSLNPLVDKLSKYMSRSVATTISLLGFLALIVGAFIPLIFIVMDEVGGLIREMPEKIAALKSFIATKTFFGEQLSNYIDVNTIGGHGTALVGNALGKTIEASASVMGAGAIIFICSMIVFYMLNDKSVMRKWFLQLFPPDIRERTSQVMGSITTKVGGFVIAQSTSMLTVGIITALGLFVLQIPYALAIGLISGLLDIIPIVGPIVATVLGISAAYSKGWGFMLGVVLIFIVAQWISNNFIRPLIFGKFMDLHPLVILLSFLIAAEFLDVWGVILAPAIAAVLAVLFDEVYVKQINKKYEEAQKEEIAGE